MEYLFLGLAAGVIIGYLVFFRFSRRRNRARYKAQSTVLLEKIRTVCKLITVEGDFSEIYHYEDLKSRWVTILLGKKKALVIVEARAHAGFDLSELRMDADIDSRTIKLTNFPQPKLLSVETDFKYYDKKDGWANPMTAADLTEINKEAKNHIIDKVPGSGLLEEAKRQALDTIRLMEQLVATINWKLDYSEMEIGSKETPMLKDENEDS